jgi:Ni,Fe-hydrogenase III small subunit
MALSLVRLLRLIWTTGRVAEPAPPAPEPAPGCPRALAGSVQIRHVDAGSCNGCEIELGAAFGPVYDAERYGARLVASPRHADVVLVTGVVTRNMLEPLRRTVEATPQPRLVVAVGDCARNCGVFAGAYGVAGAVPDAVDVDLEVPGCPPEPQVIIEVLRKVTGR